MEDLPPDPSLRTRFSVDAIYRRSAVLPRLGDERGLIADLAPATGGALARGVPRRPPALRGAGRERRALGPRTVLTMSVIFSWFGL
jgi:hypothetical protein